MTTEEPGMISNDFMVEWNSPEELTLVIFQPSRLIASSPIFVISNQSLFLLGTSPGIILVNLTSNSPSHHDASISAGPSPSPSPGFAFPGLGSIESIHVPPVSDGSAILDIPLEAEPVTISSTVSLPSSTKYTVSPALFSLSVPISFSAIMAYPPDLRT